MNANNIIGYLCWVSCLYIILCLIVSAETLRAQSLDEDMALKSLKFVGVGAFLLTIGVVYSLTQGSFAIIEGMRKSPSYYY